MPSVRRSPAKSGRRAGRGGRVIRQARPVDRATEGVPRAVPKRRNQDAAQRIFHAGHRAAQVRYADPVRAERIVNAMPDTARLSDEQVRFIESLPFFFLATSDGRANMQCNFKGGGPGVLRAGDDRTIYYPEFPGNDMMLSVGNLTVHPFVGILALSFESRRRLKINGSAERLAPADTPFSGDWPEARLIVRVSILEVIRNCSRRIPRLMPVPDATDATIK
jgi:uncharacterized protein